MDIFGIEIIQLRESLGSSERKPDLVLYRDRQFGLGCFPNVQIRKLRR